MLEEKGRVRDEGHPRPRAEQVPGFRGKEEDVHSGNSKEHVWARVAVSWDMGGEEPSQEGWARP